MIIGPSAVDEHDLTQRIISVWYARAAGFPPALSGDGSYTGIARLFPVPALRTADVKIRESIVAPANALQWKSDVRKSYIIPALEIPAFLFLLNMYDRVAYHDETQNGKKSYKTDLSTIWDNLTREHWVIDHDSFSVNQFSHPYQGTIHHGLARSAGLNFWESLLYANAGSFLWEVAGETTRPSINDQIATGTGGSFFGEALFRMSSLLLEGGGSEPGLWRELGAAVISPATGFNRLTFGNRFKAVFPGRRPATFWSARLGVNCNSDLGDRHISSHINRLEPAADFSLAYGLPGRGGTVTHGLLIISTLQYPVAAVPKTPWRASWYAACFSDIVTRRETTIAASGDYTVVMTTYRHTCCPFPAPPFHWARHFNGGFRRRCLSRGRFSGGLDTLLPVTSPTSARATIRTA